MSALPKKDSIPAPEAPRLYRPRPRPSKLDRPPAPGEVLTVGHAARLLRTSTKTACNWVDRGHLKGFRLPGSRDRRVHALDLVEFALSNGMLRKLAEVTVAEGGTLYRARVHDRWGSIVARVAPRDAPEGAGADWLPGDEPRYELKAASPEAMQVLDRAGFPYHDGR